MKKAVLSALIVLASLSAFCQTVLSDGHWYRLATYRDGIYCIPYQKIKQLGFPEPEKIRIYGNSIGMLPLMNSEPRPDCLRECSIFHYNGAVYFYAHGADSWAYDAQNRINVCTPNIYTDRGGYYITDIDSHADNTIPRRSIPAAQSTETQGIFTYHHEEMLQNIQMSGRLWMGEHFMNSGSVSVKFHCNSVPNASGILQVALASRSSQNQTFVISSGKSSREIQLKGITDSGPYADYKVETFNIGMQDSDIQNIEVEFIKTAGSSATGYLDYITLQTSEPLIYRKKQLEFESDESSHGAVRYMMENLDGNHIVMDVTENQPVMLDAGKGYFITEANGRRKFAITLPQHAYEPEYLGNVSNQNLHSLSRISYLIVTKAEFMKYAQEIAALHPEQNVAVVSDQQIYNEFSSGMRDAAAIRDFERHLYNKDHCLKYLLLLGDGSVDNLHDTPGNTNILPTYQSRNSLNENGIQSFVSDDFFGLLDDNEGEYFGDLDIGVGRLPVKNEREAAVAVEKLRNYLHDPDCTPWRQNVLFVADDENYNLHAQQADYIADMVEDKYGELNVRKMYMDSYVQETSAVGSSYPTASKDLLKQLDDGVLVFNYIGHGGMRYFADERLLTIDDIDSMKNMSRLPIVITASCNIGHFDYYNTQTDKVTDSPSERLLLNENGGAIAMLTTTREVLAAQNFTLCKNLFDVLLEKGATLGDAVRISKNRTNDINKLNFVLLGDPALPIRREESQVRIDSIQGTLATNKNELKVTGRYTIYCSMENPQLFAAGRAYVEIKDKPRLHRTLNNDGEGVFEYQDFGNTLFKGICSIVDGGFAFTFTMPKDIDYTPGAIKLSLYACNGENSASGFCKDLIMNGTAPDAPSDKIGPQIAISVTDGVMTARLSDDSGINITGTPGHRITLETNGGSPIDLTPYYEPDPDKPNSGRVDFALGALAEGIHSIRIKAWDNLNNASEKVFTTAVGNNRNLMIYNLRNDPNPFSDYTTISFAHNAPNGNVDYDLRIVDTMGKVVYIQSGSLTDGEGSISLRNSDMRLTASGLYIYRLEIRDSENREASFSKKLLFIR